MKHIKPFNNFISNEEISRILTKYCLDITIDEILNRWQEPQRYYHTINHLNDLLFDINQLKIDGKISEHEYEKLVIMAIFHDIVYEPTSSTNEEDSARIFMKSFILCKREKTDDLMNDIYEINNAIIDTKSHESSDRVSEIFNSLDMKIVTCSFDKLLEWENGIYNEFKVFGDEKYKSGRLNFLNKMVKEYPSNAENLTKLIKWVEDSY